MELSNRSLKKYNSILKNAEKEFIKYGFNKVTMDSIANTANVSKVTLYKYFSDKQILYEHILKENYFKEFNIIEETIHSDMRFNEKIDKIIKTRLAKYYSSDRLIVEKNYDQSDEMRTFISERTIIMESLNTKLYAQGKEEGMIRIDLTNETITKYFEIIRSGLIANFSTLQDIQNEDLSILFEVLYAGVLGCNKKNKEGN